MADTAVPPYVSFGIFKSTIDSLAESTVPTGPLDRRVLDGLSGADYGALMSALKFLGYIDSDRKATDSFRTLVRASKNPATFKPAFLSVLEPSYKTILGKIDLKHGTITELEKAFKEAGVSPGQMLTKTVRFFVKAMQESEFQLSHHITKPRSAGPRKRTDAARKKADVIQLVNDAPTDMARMPIPGLGDSYIQYPLALTEANCDLFEAMLTGLRAYAKSRTTGKDRKA